MNPWLILGFVLALSATAAGGYHEGAKNTRNEIQAAQLKAVTAAEHDRDLKVAKYQKVAAAAESALSAQREAARKLSIKVSHYVQTTRVVQCIPDHGDGMRLIAAAAAGRDTAEDPGKPAGQVPDQTPGAAKR